MIKRFKVYGERCTGTNYLGELIKTNFELKDMLYAFDNKHFFGHYEYNKNAKNKQIEDETLFLGIVRDPVAWINSFSKELWHVPAENCAINKFLHNQFYSVYYTTSNGKVISRHMDLCNVAQKSSIKTLVVNKDVNFTLKDNPRFQNVFELQRVKYEFLRHAMPTLVKNYVFVKYEDLCANPVSFLMQLHQNFHINFKNANSVKNVLYYKNCKNEKYIPKRITLSKEIVELIHKNAKKIE